MTDQEKQARLREAADRRLNALEGDPFLAQRIVNGEQGEIKMKKKISAALVFALCLTLICVFVLAETWPASTTHQDLTLPAGSADNGSKDGIPEGMTVLNRCAIVPVYAPVTVRMNGEEIHLTPAVAQINYLYYIYVNKDGQYAGGELPEHPVAVTKPSARVELQEQGPENTYIGYDPEAPLSTYLLTGAYLFPSLSECRFESRVDSCVITLSGEPVTITYSAEITLDEQGRIVSTREETIQAPLYLKEDAGALLDAQGAPLAGARLDDRAFATYLAMAAAHFTPSAAVSSTPLPVAAPEPTPDPAQLPVYTTKPRPYSTPMPLDASGSADTVYQNDLRLNLFYQVENFLLPTTDDTHADLLTPHVFTFFSADNFRAHWNTDLFTASDAFLRRETHPAFEADWLDILQQQYHITGEYQFIEAPDVTVEYGADAYTVRVLGGRLRFTYGVSVCYNENAVQWNSAKNRYEYAALGKYLIDENTVTVTRDELLDLIFVLPYPEE